MTVVGDVATAIVAACRTVKVGTVDVFDGQARDPDSDYLAVGWAGEDNPGITFTSAPVDAAMTSSIEVIDITCVLTLHDGSWNGATDGSAARSALLAAYNQFIAAIRDDEVLKDLLMRPAHIDRGELMVFSDESGTEARMGFTVRGQAMTNP